MNLIELLQWDDNFNTGLPQVDEQHRKLVSSCNRLVSQVAFGSSAAELTSIFDELADCADALFESEQALCRAADPPASQYHAHHESFMRKVSQLRAALDSTSSRRVAEDALGFLTCWLASHLAAIRPAHFNDAGRPVGAARDSTAGAEIRRHLHLLSDIVERSPAVAVTWRNESGWPLDYASTNITLFGYRPEDFTSGRIKYVEIVHPDDHPRNERELIHYLRHGPDDFQQEYRLRHGDGHWIWVEDHTWLTRNGAGQVTAIQGILMDMSERKRNAEISAAQWRLIEFAERHGVTEILCKVLDEAEALTDSGIGFYHFIEEDQETLSLQTWSSNTRRNLCEAVPENQQYPIAAWGVWVDAVRERKPVIQNDYAALSHEKGLPEGCAPVSRELVVPVLRSDKIVAILGVGNKPDPYGDPDIAAVQKLADLAWEIVQRKQAEEFLKHRTAELEQRTAELARANAVLGQLATVFTHAREGIFITDPDGVILEVNEAFARITGYRRAEAIGQNPRLLQSGRHTPEFYTGMWRALLEAGHWSGEIWNRRRNGEAYPEFLTISAVRDGTGITRQYVALFADITTQKEHQSQLEHVAHYDALTGPPTVTCWPTGCARPWPRPCGAARTWPSPFSTWMASRPSMIGTATMSATGCCAWWPSA